MRKREGEEMRKRREREEMRRREVGVVKERRRE